MRKFFTFIACALVALSANAKLDLSLDELPNGWGSSYDPATKTITYEAGQWGGRGWNLSAVANLTDYQYFVVELASPSNLSKLKLNIEYADELNAEENNGNNSDGMLENPNTFYGVELDPDESYALQAYVANSTWAADAIGSNPGGTVVLKAAYLCTKAEYEAALAEYKNKEMKKECTINAAVDGVLTMAAGGWGWYDTGWLQWGVSDYKSLVFNLGPVTGKCKVTIQGSKDGEVFIEPSDKPQLVVWELPEGFTTLKQFAFQNGNKLDDEEDDAIKETVVNINSIYLSTLTKDKVITGISNTIAAPVANPNAPIFNLAGQKVSKAYKGVVIQNGKKFVQK